MLKPVWTKTLRVRPTSAFRAHGSFWIRPRDAIMESPAKQGSSVDNELVSDRQDEQQDLETQMPLFVGPILPSPMTLVPIMLLLAQRNYFCMIDSLALHRLFRR